MTNEKKLKEEKEVIEIETTVLFHIRDIYLPDKLKNLHHAWVVVIRGIFVKSVHKDGILYNVTNNKRFNIIYTQSINPATNMYLDNDRQRASVLCQTPHFLQRTDFKPSSSYIV